MDLHHKAFMVVLWTFGTDHLQVTLQSLQILMQLSHPVFLVHFEKTVTGQ